MKVTVMTLAGCCESADFQEDDTIRDVSLFIRFKFGMPVAVQSLMTGYTILREPAESLKEVFGEQTPEAVVMVIRRPYTPPERAELFRRLVRATGAGDTRQVRELLKEGAPVDMLADVKDVSASLDHWETEEEEVPKEEEKKDKTKKETKGKNAEDTSDMESEEEGRASEMSFAGDSDDMQEEEEKEKAEQPPCGGITPLMMAMATGRGTLAQDLRRLGACEADMVPKSESLVAACVACDVVEIFRHLAKGADTETRLQRGQGIRATEEGTLLHACAANFRRPGFYEVAQLLIHRGANLDAGDSEGDTPLAHARYFDCQELFQLYSGNGATIAGPFYSRWEQHPEMQRLQRILQLNQLEAEEE
ncbi:unnamed protein product [Effrenium voratum]|uniref:Uncharacterized protein n=1 Tax=Effrenium voratum TaxID=2562239 RepID=A0AA36HRV9_9DINO|nr:unnamed protein product [Effrenium voratum]